MSAGLDRTNGVASFVAAKDDAWHRMGITLPEEFTAEEAMLYGRLGGWKVRKVPMFAREEHLDPDTGEMIPMDLWVPDKYAVVRNNPVILDQVDVLGVVGRTYCIVQNEELAELLDALVDESGAHFDTAGAIDGGRKVFITMRLPGNMLVGGVDRVDLFLAIVTSHDGSWATVLMVTPVRIVCKNTLNMGLRRATGIFRVKHTARASATIRREARNALDLSFSYLDEFQAEAEAMINSTLTESRFEEILEREFGAPDDAPQSTLTKSRNRIETITQLFEEAQTQDNIRGTVWAGFNALTEYAEYFSTVRPSGDETEDFTRAAKTILDPAFKNKARQLMLAEVK